ncbi:hypothetical protein ACHAWX_001425, partial [Stephanocyclus meneghinianus]
HRGTKKVKRRFVLVVEFLVSVGDELVFVAASEVFPEFPKGRNVSVSELSHTRLDPTKGEDVMVMDRMQWCGSFYASVGMVNHYLEYHPNAFFPIIGGWGNNAVRPLSKSGRVRVNILLSLPKPPPDQVSIKSITTAWYSPPDSPSRPPSITKLGIQRPALGGIGECGNVNYIRFQDSAFEQLLLAEDKMELIHAVARNAGGWSNFDFDEESIGEEEEDNDEIGLDVVVNKRAASIFLLSALLARLLQQKPLQNC